MNKGLFKTALLLLMMAASVTSVFGQHLKIIVFPADQWCIKNGYVTTYDDWGEQKQEPDYKKALENNPNMADMISAIENILPREDGLFNTKLNAELNALDSKEAHDMTKGVSKHPGTTKEKLLPDIIIELDFTEMKKGPKTQTNFNLQAMDAFSGKTFFSHRGSFSSLAECDNAIQNFKDNLLSALTNHVNKLNTEGRQITISVKRSTDCPINFEEEYNGTELGKLIENWVKENTVNGRFHIKSANENSIDFDEVSIPMHKDDGKPFSVSLWCRDLARFIKRNTGYKCEVRQRLGTISITMGEQ